MKLPILAYILAGLPLLAGSAIFFLWTLTRFQGLIVAGFLTIGLGLILTTVSAGILTLYGRQNFKSPTQEPHWLRNIIIGLCIILANFPLALLYMGNALKLDAQVEITLSNQSQFTLADFELDCQGKIIEIPEFKPQAQQNIECYPSTEGALKISFSQGQQNYTQELGYVSPGMGGKYALEIQPNLQAHLK